ncbi:MAG: selenocysteine-specific translation elongation factor [Bacillota bacterium]
MADNLIIGTAGHVDHGKTTLISALTGENTDRLQEEQERGLSIDLGFSHLELEDGLQAGIIDVPGHEKFIKNMLAGAGGVDIGLLVIAADEAVMEQTQEHLAILELLNVKQGLIAVTKVDQVETEWLQLVIEEIEDFVQGTFLEEAAIVPVSGVTGTGIKKLKEELSRLMSSFPDKDKQANVYFPIDRVFSVAGHGTVVTGTLMQGQINLGDELEIYPQGLKARVRGLQVHQEQVEKALPGQRIGINVADVEQEEVNRGAVLATKDSLVASEYLDARLELLEQAPLILEHGARIRLHIGAKEVLGRVYLLERDKLYPGEEALVQFRLEEPVVANFKECYVLRRHSPMTTIGGGQILDSNPERHRSGDHEIISILKRKETGSNEERVELALQLNTSKALKIQDLVFKTSLARQQIETILSSLTQQNKVVEIAVGEQSSWLHKETYNNVVIEIKDYVAQYQQLYHLRLGIPKEELRTKLSLNLDHKEFDFLLKDLKAERKLKEREAKISLADFSIELSKAEKQLQDEIIEEFSKNKYMPPKLSELKSNYQQQELVEEICDLLIRKQKLVKVAYDLYFTNQAILDAEKSLRDYLEQEAEIDVAKFRDLLDSSRKYALPLLEYFDQRGVTVREGDIRVLGEI